MDIPKYSSKDLSIHLQYDKKTLAEFKKIKVSNAVTEHAFNGVYELTGIPLDQYLRLDIKGREAIIDGIDKFHSKRQEMVKGLDNEEV